MLKISGGQSDKDRISIYTIDDAATAIRNKNGEITIEYVKENVSLTKAIAVLIGIFATFSLVKAFVLIPLIKTNIIGTVWYLIPAFFYSFLAVKSIIALRKRYGQEFLKNHGAEHKVVTAYEKLGRIPTVEQANQFSRIHRCCGVTIFSAFITSQIIGFIVYIQTSYIIPEIILFLMPLVFQKIFPFNFIGKLAQFFTTSIPERRNIELAIAALSALEHRELLKNKQILERKELIDKMVRDAFDSMFMK